MVSPSMGFVCERGCRSLTDRTAAPAPEHSGSFAGMFVIVNILSVTGGLLRVLITELHTYEAIRPASLLSLSFPSMCGHPLPHLGDQTNGNLVRGCR